MPRYRLTIAYDGTDFCGWQKQWSTRPRPGAVDAASPPDAAPATDADRGHRPPLRTVQHVLEQAVRAVVRRPIEVLGASRTDSGVHAKAQTAVFTCDDQTPRPPDDRLADAVNSRLPEDALVIDARRVRDDFDPISDCLSKGYRYTLHVGPKRPLWNRRYVHHLWKPIEIEPMAAAAERLIGEHDFAAFTNAGHGRQSTIRTVLSCSVAPAAGECVTIDVSGSGFLYNMVRIIAGTLVEVGRGRIDLAQVRRALECGDRRLAGPTLPPEGLCLEWIRYPDDDASAD